jgi:hypothetical protein
VNARISNDRMVYCEGGTNKLRTQQQQQQQQAAHRWQAQQALRVGGSAGTSGRANWHIQQQQEQRQPSGVITSSNGSRHCRQHSSLQPTDAEHLRDAQTWVANWPEAVGSTTLLTALCAAHQCAQEQRYGQHLQGSTSLGPGWPEQAAGPTVDCYYLFSDGLADDHAACLEWVQQQADQGQPVMPIHCVGECCWSRMWSCQWCLGPVQSVICLLSQAKFAYRTFLRFLQLFFFLRLLLWMMEGTMLQHPLSLIETRGTDMLNLCICATLVQLVHLERD